MCLLYLALCSQAAGKTNGKGSGAASSKKRKSESEDSYAEDVSGKKRRPALRKGKLQEAEDKEEAGKGDGKDKDKINSVTHHKEYMAFDRRPVLKP